MSDQNKFKIYIQRKAFRKYRYFIDLCEDEISGFGKCEKIGGKMVITDFQIFKQVVSGAHSDMDDDALAAFLFEKTKAKEDLSQWRVWWHSHAAMQTFFSGTDTDTIDKSTEFPWLISIVGNHAGDIKARIDVYDPIRFNEDVEVEILEDEDLELKSLCLSEIKEKVSKRADFFLPEHSKGGGHHYPNYKGKNKHKSHYWGQKKEGESDTEFSERMADFYRRD